MNTRAIDKAARKDRKRNKSRRYPKRVAWNRKCVCGHRYNWHHNWSGGYGGRCQDTTEMRGCGCHRFKDHEVRPAKAKRGR